MSVLRSEQKMREGGLILSNIGGVAERREEKESEAA